MQKLGIAGEQCIKLVGIGTDGVAANIAGAGVKGISCHGYFGCGVWPIGRNWQ